MPSFTSAEAAAVRSALLGWFRRRARSLPWRGAKSPYEVWLSEIMLQQTQIATVIPFYQRFLAEFPTVGRLARAPLERVLERWSGLGYYRRARQLHQAARAMVEKHSGRFPRDYAQARSLPGVGDYTARAVLSIAYGQPYAVADGNVARVMARVRALGGSLAQPAFRRKIEADLDLLLSRRRPGNFNQAMMELGQTICLPRAPQCPACPLRPWCRAFHLGKPDSFPAPRPRRRAERWHLATAVLRRDRRVLMFRGLDEGLLDDLWNFPAALGLSSAAALARLRKKIRSELGASIPLQEPSHHLNHNITYRSIRVEIYAGEFAGKPRGSGYRWLAAKSVPQGAVSQLARKIARKLA